MKRMIATLAALLLLAGCGATPTSAVKGDNTGGDTPTTTDTTAPAPPAADGITAEFKVTTNSSKTSVSWGTGAGLSQDEIKKSSWSKKVKLDDFDVATVTVTSSDYLKSRKVTCEILINGVSKSKNSAKGKMAITSCSANTTD
jgi:ABC-type glycerol-3-phosphate transport system substrate-binding protein